MFELRKASRHRFLLVSPLALISSKNRGRSAFDSLGPDTQANQEFCDFGRLAPAQRGTCGGEQQNAAAQYSSASMMVITLSVSEGSAGSGECCLLLCARRSACFKRKLTVRNPQLAKTQYAERSFRRWCGTATYGSGFDCLPCPNRPFRLSVTTEQA